MKLSLTPLPLLTALLAATAAIPSVGRCGELAQVGEGSNQTLAVSFLDPMSGATQPVSSSFGTVNALTFFGAYVAPGVNHFGAVEANSSGATWRLIDRAGAPAGELSFGSGANILLAGGDFDDDGILDPAILETSGNSLQVRVRPGAFTSAPGAEVVRIVGTKGQKSLAFFADLDGSGDRIGVVRKLPGFPATKPRYQIRLTDPIDGKKRTIVLASVGAVSQAPLPLRQSNGTDAVVVVHEISGDNPAVRVTVLKRNGRKRAGLTFSGAGVVVVGDLDESDPGEEIGFHSGTELRIYNPTSKVTRLITIPAGTLVDSISIARNSRPSSGPVACGGTPGICGCSFLDETDGYKVGFVYKAKSDTFGGIVAVLPNPCGRSTTGVSVLDTSCNLIEELSDNGYGNADSTGVRHHFKRRDNHTGSYYRNLVGSIVLRLNGTDGCYLIGNPAQKRVD